MKSAMFRRLAGKALFGSLLLFAPLAANAAPRSASAPHGNPILDRLQSITVMPLAGWRIHPVDGKHWESPAADDSAWPAYKTGQEWTAGSMWLRRSLDLSSSLNGYDLRGARLRLHLDIGGELTTRIYVYVNGVQVAEGQDLESALLTPSAEPGKMLLAIKVQVLPGKASIRRARIDVASAPGRPNPRVFLEECEAAQNIISAFPRHQAGRDAIVGAALGAIHWGALGRGDQAGFDHSLKAAQQTLEALNPWLKTFTIHATGNTHIDMAWLWPRSETVNVVRNTFTSALELMQEFPNFTFTMSTAQAYAWMQEKYPELFAQIRQRIKEGRWEPVGGMWVEPDLNMPDGESIVRQLLVGEQYFKNELGVDTRIGWNPDSFGYNWQLPQIYKKSGMDFFVTQKLAWNDTTRFPYSLFWWESPDGSKVLTYFPHDYANPIDPLKMSRDLADFEERAHYPVMMHLYGVGDHGGGPTRHMLEDARRWENPKAVFPRLELGTAGSYLDSIYAKAKSLDLPTWDDELYLEFHRGVYTSQAETKKANRRCETLLLEAEKFASLASLLGRPYPQAEFETAWKKVLFNQFHDIMAGSGIHPVYVDAARDHAEVERIGKEILHGALGEISAHADTQGAGVPVIVYNPLSWTRTDVVEVVAEFPRPATYVEVKAPSGHTALSEVVARDPNTNRIRVRFIAENVPPVGYAVFHLIPVSHAPHLHSPLVARGDTLENEFLRVRVDPKTGCLSSLFVKKGKLELLSPHACGNLLQTFVDKPKAWDAWNIDANFEDHMWNLTQPEEVKLIEAGPVRAVIRVVKKFQNSTFTQDITMYPHIPRVDVRMSADWHEQHILLKVAFPLAVKSNFATFEIPYGTIQRPTTRRTPAEKAKFEVPALRWADLSDGKQGLSLLNDCKYGYDAKGNVLRLSLLRSPTWPDPTADQGLHRFTYSLYPHAGDWKQADSMRQGYNLNTLLLAKPTTAHSGQLPATFSFVQIEPDDLILTAIKKAEDGNSLIFRFYEFDGRRTRAHLFVPAGAVDAQETNLMETPVRNLSLQGSEILLPTGPYEINTVKVRFSADPPVPSPEPGRK